MRAGLALLLCAGFGLAACSEGLLPKGEKGDTGPAGPPGPAGPAGPPGPSGSTLRFAEFTCEEPTCPAACEDNERLVSAYSLNPGGTFVVEDDRRVTFRPTRRPTGKVVLICAAQ